MAQGFAGRVVDRVRVSPRDLGALRKGSVLKLWILKSWAAAVAAVLYFAFGHWIFPAAMRPLLRLVFPPTRGSGLVRLQTFLDNSWVENPRVDQMLAWLSPIVWLFGFSLVMALLELAIKPALEAARSRSRFLEHAADAKLATSPSESVMLLRQAKDLAVDARREEDLMRKLNEIDGRLSQGVAMTAAPRSGSGSGSGSGEKPRASDGSWTPAPISVPSVAATVGPDGSNVRRVGPRGRYRLDSELARGGMGVVHRAFDTVLERTVAMKELPPTKDPSLRDRFRQEAQALARLSHANVVQVYDLVEEDDERLYIAMELIDGGSLDEVIAGGKLSLSRGLELARQVALGLSAAHKRGIVHRDVKPLNVLVAANDGTAKVTDFGLAKLAEATMNTVEGSVMGSPRYMSPEQASGKAADARSDVYSFGATLFHLLTGRPPFDGDVSAVLASHITQPPPAASTLNPSIPKELDRLIASLLAKEPAQRPADLSDVATKLAAFR